MVLFGAGRESFAGPAVKVRMRAFYGLLVVVLLCGAHVVADDGAAIDPPRVSAVVIYGNEHLSDSAVLSSIRTSKGQIYRESIVFKDRSRLLRTGRFKSVVATMDETPGGIVVTFVVVEHPLVTKVSFRGNKEFSSKKLSKELTFSASDPLNVFTVEAARRAILLKYRDESYYFVRVSYDRTAMKQRGEVEFTIVEGPRVYVRDIDFEGNSFFGDLSLGWTAKSTTKPKWWLLPGGRLDMEKIQKDVELIRAKYVEEGFLDAEVSRRIEFSDDKKDVRITFLIRENSRYRINNIRFQGNKVYSSEELVGRLKLSRGDLAKGLAMTRDTKRIQDAFGQLGYIYCRVKLKKRFVSPEIPLPAWATDMGPESVGLVNLVYEVEEGDQYRVGRVEIRQKSAYRYGQAATQTRIARRAVTLTPGQLFSTGAQNESLRRLRETQLFGEPTTIRPVGKKPSVRDALVEPTEAPTSNFMIGVSANSNTGLSGNIVYRQQNFDMLAWPRAWRDVADGFAWRGAGQSLSITLEPGTDVSRFNVSWSDSAIWDLPYRLSVQGYAMQGSRETYDENRIGGVVSIGRRFPNGWYTEVSSRTEVVEVADIDFTAPSDVFDAKGHNFMQNVGFALVRDRTDSRLMPTTGDRFEIRFNQMLGDYTFEKINIDYRVYQTLHVDAMDRSHVLAMKVSSGQILGDAPVFERFYGGGIGSVRGFEYRGISPRGGVGDDPVGGDFLVFAGAEYRFPLAGKQLHGVLFLDSGAVDQDAHINTYRVATGFGIRWTVPMLGPMPFRLDFGFPIVKSDQDDTQVFSFTLGWRF